MSFQNRITSEQLTLLAPGDQIVHESSRGSFSGSEILHGTVAKLTPKQIVVHYSGVRGTIEARFRREDGVRIGPTRGELLDPTHQFTLDAMAQRRLGRQRQEIDRLANRWSRERDNLDLLRQLQVAIGEYLDAKP